MLNILRPTTRPTILSVIRTCSTKAAENINPYDKYITSERIQEIARSPSGWVPPIDPPPPIPFYVRRNRFNELPVLVKATGGGTRIITQVRNVRGDLKELEQCVRLRIGDQLHYQINELTSTLKVKGDFKDDIVRLLKELGF